MKKLNFIALLFLILGGCNERGKQTTEAVDPEPAIVTAPPADFPLMAKYDCATCHRVDEKLQGPSYIEIANKYAAQSGSVKYLTDKIINGSTGVWGTVPMNAHPGMPKDDADKISRYILSLKK
jgi:cytochrome c551/c552